MLTVKTAHQTITAQWDPSAVTPSPAAPAAANPTAPTGSTQAPATNVRYKPEGLMQHLMQAAQQFAQTHNKQIQQYNPAIQQIKQISKQIGTNPSMMTPQLLQQAAALAQMLQQAKTDEVQDSQFLNKITQATQSLAQAIGGGQQATTPAANQTPASGQTTVSPAGTAGFGLGRAVKAPGRAIGRGVGKAWNAVKNVGKGIGQGVGDFASGFAMAENNTLNAKMGSAESLFMDGSDSE